jgi:hypothetical protein
MMGGCTYTVRSSEGIKISSAQIQELKLGKTTETELLSLLGPATKRETKADGSVVLLYIHTSIETPTLPGGYILWGFLEKDREETFEVVLKNGIVQSFHYIKP